MRASRLRPRRIASAIRWRVARAALARGLFRSRILRGRPQITDLAVVMCLWNRPGRIDDVLGMLARQTGSRPVRLILWNNRRSDDAHYRRRILEHPLSPAVASVEYVRSAVNVGGMGRFYAIARLRRQGYRGPVLLLDDDEDVRPEFVAQMEAAAGERTIAGFWAWTMHDDYWAREPAGPGDRVSYVGTGGCIVDSSVVELAGFFAIPRYFAFIEDLWMCGLARHEGWALRKADVDIEFVLDETNQHHSLGPKKGELYRWLRLEDPD